MKKLFLKFFIIFFVSAYADDFRIVTSSGITQGFIKSNVVNWKDIPYAKPPIDDLRWKAPRKIEQNSNLIKPKNNNFCLDYYIWDNSHEVKSLVCSKDISGVDGISSGDLYFQIWRSSCSSSIINSYYFTRISNY